LANVKQAVLNAFRTTQGELVFHPNYGINTNVGGQFFGTTDEALIFGDLLTKTLLNDPRFTDIKISNVSTTGTGISLSLLVKIAGSNVPVPLNFVS